jgi:hypothetical protein
LRFHFTLTITPEACGASGLLASHSEVSDTLIEKSPVVFTCDISVLQDLRRTKAVLGGL